MSAVILTKSYSGIPFCEKEILRYAGCKEADEAVASLMRECIDQATGILTYNVCYGIFDVTLNESSCDFGDFTLCSKNLATNLAGAQQAAVFAATVGVGLDRLITRYSRLSPSRALMMQAIGAERIEALCDTFCADIGTISPRFSPGYGDLPLECQKNIFAVLGCSGRIGVSLTDSLLMSPSKSVTAIAAYKKRRI